MIDGKLSLVLPAHNEQENIREVVNQAINVLPRFADSFEIIIVNDGSADSTGEIADELAAVQQFVRVVHHATNRGYGAALISGFRSSSGDWVMVMDSDRQFDLGDLVYLAPLVGAYDLVAGYRIRRNDPVHRVVFGRIFKLAVHFLFGLNMHDIDCAFKVIRGDLLRTLDLQSTGALVSTELMAKWVRMGATWTQVGVHHYPRPAGQQSGGSLRVVFRAMKDIPLLWYRLNRYGQMEFDSGERPKQRGLSIAGAAAIVVAVLGVLAVVVSRLLKRH
jgi:glycosyltransferase involved in cell wall biosynthesis